MKPSKLSIANLRTIWQKQSVIENTIPPSLIIETDAEKDTGTIHREV